METQHPPLKEGFSKILTFFTRRSKEKNLSIPSLSTTIDGEKELLVQEDEALIQYVNRLADKYPTDYSKALFRAASMCTIILTLGDKYHPVMGNEDILSEIFTKFEPKESGAKIKLNAYLANSFIGDLNILRTHLFPILDSSLNYTFPTGVRGLEESSKILEFGSILFDKVEEFRKNNANQYYPSLHYINMTLAQRFGLNALF